MAVRGEAGRLPVAAAFATIYVVWGSTYLAIAYAVETMPPFLTMAARMLLAGGALYGWSRSRGEACLTGAEWRWAAVTGALLFLGGYGALAWAEQRIESGTAALLGTTSPLWLVLIQWQRGGRRPSPGTWAGLVLGMVGVLLLIGSLEAGLAELLPAAAVLVAAFFWAAGSLRASKSPLTGSASRSAGAEMLAGGVVVLAAGLLVGEGPDATAAAFTLRSVGALAYLVVFGSIAAFCAYRWLLQERPPALVATHSYVNPFVALLLGWMLAGESLGPNVLLAAISIVGAIALLRRDQVEGGAARAKAEPLPSSATMPEATSVSRVTPWRLSLRQLPVTASDPVTHRPPCAR
ncbi:MAG TPA: EamA family transporter [Longimicrobiales bacterium]|nr:EamA family transporter [Longimicrobiales bacterium]